MAYYTYTIYILYVLLHLACCSCIDQHQHWYIQYIQPLAWMLVFAAVRVRLQTQQYCFTIACRKALLQEILPISRVIYLSYTLLLQQPHIINIIFDQACKQNFHLLAAGAWLWCKFGASDPRASSGGRPFLPWGKIGQFARSPVCWNTGRLLGKSQRETSVWWSFSWCYFKIYLSV